MKVESQQIIERDKFKPCSITITLENQGEFNAFQFLFNFIPLSKVIEHHSSLDTNLILNALSSIGSYDMRVFSEIKNDIKNSVGRLP